VFVVGFLVFELFGISGGWFLLVVVGLGVGV
jgi:hypothetical protein